LKSGPRCLNDEMAKDIGADVAHCPASGPMRQNWGFS
jgi:hypothetical protein